MTEPTTAAVCSCGARTKPHPKGETPCMYLAPGQPVYETTTAVPYDRAVLIDVLVYHYRKDIAGCGCGWAELGRSWPEHVATVYEESVRARA